MSKPSSSMLTTGLVGSWLLASAWAVMLLGAIVLLFTGVGTLDMQIGMSIGGFAVIAGLLWLGGAVCEGIGWIGLGRLHPGLPPVIGWLEAALPPLSLILFAVAITMLDLPDVIAHLMVILFLSHFLLAFVWMLRHGPRGLTVPAAIGYGLALAGGLTLYACALARVDVEAFALVLLVAFLTGGTAAHLATALLFSRSRALADSINTF